MPGIFVQNAIFGSTATAIGLAEDLKKGMLDRFRSLPMARSAVAGGPDHRRPREELPVGRRDGGDRLHRRVPVRERARSRPSACVLLVVTVGFTFSWISATIGLAIKQVEAVQAAIFTLIFPIVFVSAAFVPVVGMSHVLQPIARHNPVTYWCNLARWLSIGPGRGGRPGHPRRHLHVPPTGHVLVRVDRAAARDLRSAVDPAYRRLT